MIIEKTGRTKECTDCGLIAHNTVMQTHNCIINITEPTMYMKTKKTIKKVAKKAVKKPTKKAVNKVSKKK